MMTMTSAGGCDAMARAWPLSDHLCVLFCSLPPFCSPPLLLSFTLPPSFSALFCSVLLCFALFCSVCALVLALAACSSQESTSWGTQRGQPTSPTTRSSTCATRYLAMRSALLLKWFGRCDWTTQSQLRLGAEEIGSGVSCRYAEVTKTKTNKQ
eukprot:3831733-Rhodomonas_salina.1